MEKEQKKRLKKYWTDVAAGRISVDKLGKDKKTPQNKPKQPSDTHKRKKQLNNKGGK